MTIPTHDRRDFLGRSLALLMVFLTPSGGRAGRVRSAHPDPRPGIDASHVLPREQLADHADAITAFDQVREIPQIVDGIRCSCGCASREGFYSLLSCYEGEGMARMCEVCQGTARLAYRLHTQGNSLKDIRDAVDARFR